MLAGSVYESGGRTVSRTVKRTVWPADALVGVRPLFDVKDGANANGPAGFEIISSNAKGDLLAANNLKVTLVRERRDYHWTWDKESGWRFDYTQRYEESDNRDLKIELAGARSTRSNGANTASKYSIQPMLRRCLPRLSPMTGTANRGAGRA